VSPRKRTAPPQSRPSRNTTNAIKSNGHRAAPTDFDVDQRIVDRSGDPLWEALFNGRFRLAVRCDICGRWLTATESKKAHRGPRCSARAGDDR
jgi:hypothetical protein